MVENTTNTDTTTRVLWDAIEGHGLACPDSEETIEKIMAIAAEMEDEGPPENVIESHKRHLAFPYYEDCELVLVASSHPFTPQDGERVVASENWGGYHFPAGRTQRITLRWAAMFTHANMGGIFTPRGVSRRKLPMIGSIG